MQPGPASANASAPTAAMEFWPLDVALPPTPWPGPPKSELGMPRPACGGSVVLTRASAWSPVACMPVNDSDRPVLLGSAANSA